MTAWAAIKPRLLKSQPAALRVDDWREISGIVLTPGNTADAKGAHLLEHFSF